jgi:hypothetical protein
MSGRPLPDELPPGWISRWSSDAFEPLPRSFRDNPDTAHPVRLDEIESTNRDTLSQIMRAAGLE